MADNYAAQTYSKRQRLEMVRSQLEQERASFIPSWRESGDNILPRRPRFFTSDSNRGDRRNQKIINSTPTLAARTLRSGMMGGITSPARPWFRLTTPDPGMATIDSVKEWLHVVSQRMATVFLKSNLYNVLPIMYGDLGVFGTACMIVEEDFDDVLRCYPFPIGSYYLAQDERLRVDTFMRDFRMTARQIVQRFGMMPNSTEIDWTNISPQVKDLFLTNRGETWIEVSHVIMRNPDYDPHKVGSKFKKFMSCYYERASSGATLAQADGSKFDLLLSEKGYDYFPILAPRWEVTGEDVYGTDCPGTTAVGDIKALQTMEKRLAQAIEKMINPPMVGPSSLKNSKSTILPGDITYLDEREGQRGFRPAHEVNPHVQEVIAAIQKHEQRISRAMFEDLFLMLSQSDRREITATEIDERKEEKLLALGPVLEQLNQDLLDPLIDICFALCLRQGLIPPPPPELQGVPLKVEYISVMAQAQKLIGVQSIEHYVSFIGQVAGFVPAIAEKIDTDKLADIYGDLRSIPPGIIRSDDVVAQIRAQAQKAQAAQAQMQAIQQGAGAAKDLSQTDMSGNNALSALLGGGSGAPSAVV